MHSLLEIKRAGTSPKTIIFPTDSLPIDDIDLDNVGTILEAICLELSTYMPGDLFMPHEVSDIVAGSLDEGDYNANDWVVIKASVYDIVIAFSDILFRTLNNHSTVSLVSIDEMTTRVSYHESPMENF